MHRDIELLSMQETGVLVSCCCVVSVLGKLASISIISIGKPGRPTFRHLEMHAGQRIHVCTRMGSVMIFHINDEHVLVAQQIPPTPVYGFSPTKCQEYAAETQADMEQTLYSTHMQNHLTGREMKIECWPEEET